MLIDMHTHIVPDAIRNNLEEYCKRDPLIGSVYWKIFGQKKGKMIGVEELIASMDEAGIDKSGICNYPWSNHEICVEGNDYVLESIARYPQRLFGYCSVQQTSGEAAVSEIERCISNGMVGVGELALVIQAQDIEGNEFLQLVMETVKRLGVCVMIHCDEPVGHQYLAKGDTTPRTIYKLIKQYPEVTFILAHWGGGFFFYELMPDVKKEAKNVYYDTSNSPFVYSPTIYRVAVDIVGPKKILFGTDYPLLNPKKQLKEIEDSGISRNDMHDILSGNINKILRID